MLRTPDQMVKTAPEGLGTAFGTFGELLQGVLPENLDFLVTLPIAKFAHAVFAVDSKRDEVQVFPEHKQKARRLAERILQYYNLPAGGLLTIHSDILEGKGLASSSADLVATARAVASCYGIKLPLGLLERFLGEIEPTDGVMYDGIVAFYHRTVRLRERLGSLSPLTVVAVDEGGEVDSIEFNKLPKPFDEADKREYEHLLETVAQAIRYDDMETVGRVATRSAQLNQKLRPKQKLDDVIALSREVSALGTVIAHSGTFMGILLRKNSPKYSEQLGIVTRELSSIASNVDVFHTLSFPEGMRNYA